MRVIIIVLCLSGCSTTRDAVTDPNVWAPIAAAAAIQINDIDGRLTEYLAEENPLFGDIENAKNWSDKFRNYTGVAYLSTALLIDTSADIRVMTLVGEYASVQVVDEFRGELKTAIGRERPDGTNDRSMPSGHTNTAAYQASLAETNLDSIAMPDDTRRALDITLRTMAGLTGWARVEGNKHYVSDVLVGYGLGYFFGHYADALFNRNVHVSVSAGLKNQSVVVTYNF